MTLILLTNHSVCQLISSINRRVRGVATVSGVRLEFPCRLQSTLDFGNLGVGVYECVLMCV